MAVLALMGVVTGIFFAYWVTGSKRYFREKLLADLTEHSRKGPASDYVTGILHHRAQWAKSISFIRKPFRKEINLAVETAGLVLSLTGLISGLSNFDQTFNGPMEGGAVLMFLLALLYTMSVKSFLVTDISTCPNRMS